MVVGIKPEVADETIVVIVEKRNGRCIVFGCMIIPDYLGSLY